MLPAALSAKVNTADTLHWLQTTHVPASKYTICTQIDSCVSNLITSVTRQYSMRDGYQSPKQVEFAKYHSGTESSLRR
jgi:hypothetical protein